MRYRIEAEPLFGRHCWCRECQYLGAGSGTVNVFFPSDAGGADSAVINQSRNESCVVPSFCASGSTSGTESELCEKTADGKMKKPRTGGERGF